MAGRGGAGPLRVAIVGGGITGLSAAYYLRRLARAGRRPIRAFVFEQSRRLGGKVRTETRDGFIMEAGPDCYLVRKPWMAELCRDLGLEARLVSLGGRPGAPSATGTFVRIGDELHRLPAGSFMGIPGRWSAVAHSDLLSRRGKLRLAMEPFVPVRREGGPEESLAQFGRRRLGYEASVRLVEPLLAGISGGDPHALGVDAAFPGLAEMERRYGSLQAGVNAVLERVRRSGPSSPPFETVDTGLETVVETLRAETEGPEVTFRLGTGVRAVRRPADQMEGPPLEVVLENGEVDRFDHVVLTVPAAAVARILASSAPDAEALLAQIPYASAASVYLAYRREDVPHPLDGTGYVGSKEEERAVSSCTWASSKWPHCAVDGHVLLRCHMGAVDGVAPSNRPEADLIADARAEVRRMLGISVSPLLVRVFRWPNALPQYGPGHRERLERLEAAVRAALPGVYLAGAAYRGLGLPDCVKQGKEAAERILREG